MPVNEPDDKSHGASVAMEFAVKHIKVKHIIIFGHSECGGIKSLMEGDHIDHDYAFIDPWIKQRFDAGELFLHAWYFDIDSGSLLGKQGDQFVPINEIEIHR